MSRLGCLFMLLVAACGDDSRVHHLPDGPPFPDAAKGIYVTLAGNKLTVYALDAVGDAAPLRTISGAATGLNLSLGFDVQPGTGDLFVANRMGGTVTVYPPEATGNVAPTKTLMATGMGSPAGVVFATNGDLYVSTCPGCGASNGGLSGVFRFPAGSNTSDATLGGTTNTNTMFTNPGVTIDPDTGNLVVGNSFGGNVSTFPASATGDVAPIRAFSPGAINLQSVGVAAGTVFVTSGTGAAIQMFPIGATGTPTPVTMANGGMLNVNYPAGLFIEGAGTQPVIYLADFFGNKIHIIQTAGSAPAFTVASVQTIEGPSTGLVMPIGVKIVR